MKFSYNESYAEVRIYSDHLNIQIHPDKSSDPEFEYYGLKCHIMGKIIEYFIKRSTVIANFTDDNGEPFI